MEQGGCTAADRTQGKSEPKPETVRRENGFRRAGQRLTLLNTAAGVSRIASMIQRQNHGA